MPVDKNTIERQLEALGDFHHFFTASEIRYLPEIIAIGETIYGITSGLYEGKTWLIVITNLRLIFLDKGMFYGLRQMDMPVSQISSVSHKTGLFFGEIEVATASGSKKIGSIAKRDILKVVSVIAGIIHGVEQPVATKPNAIDLASQLERLADLHGRGSLTDDEFRISKEATLKAAENR